MIIDTQEIIKMRFENLFINFNKKKLPQFITIIVISLLYFITARIGLSLSSVNKFATLLWLPSGISLASLLIFGFRVWPGVTIGAFLANYLTGASPIAALMISIGNTLEALVGAYLLRDVFRFRNSLSRLKDVLSLFVVAGIFSTLISATIGTLTILIDHVILWESFGHTWLVWWIGDMVSDLTVTPLFLVWSTGVLFRINLKRSFEALIVSISLIGIYLILFRNLFQLSALNDSPIYIVFPIMIWTALRFGQPGIVIANFIFSTFAAWGTVVGLGPFTKGDVDHNLLSLQVFTIITSVTTLILAAVVSERKRSEEIKDEFISIASHELKTPITTIKGYTQLLNNEFSKVEHNKGNLYISKIESQIDHLARMSDDFFDVAKIQSGKLSLQKEIFNIIDLVKEIVEDVQRVSKNHKIKIMGDTNQKVFADKYRIGQVLTNLLGNAIKFSPKSQKINVMIAKNRFSVTVSVEDFGIGISRRDIDNIFERFFQAKSQVRPSESGLGLGLYISSEVLKLHSGRIWVKSQKGKGTTFTFSLPIYNRFSK